MLKAGDTFSIETDSGVGYFQFIKINKTYGSLIRVVPGVFPFDDCFSPDRLQVESNFWCFFPVSACLKKNLISKVGCYPIPEHAVVPFFRHGVVNQSTKKVDTWWLWNGEQEWMVGELNNEQRRLPILGVWNDSLLRNRLEAGWLPELDIW
ncbi:hypothetical protein LIN78_00530 [Leeia sp. TBRC 13508]|uniref:Uncharacterized protein n=1 Tax=Leeia speluncae TaxID=2884804 RepID=A0ABS8D1G9_9NEIS|nr:hypothetical protein [Leeia speluncae]MCB6182041.1 hypothetical protein [Leeia speluncae]